MNTLEKNISVWTLEFSGELKRINDQAIEPVKVTPIQTTDGCLYLVPDALLRPGFTAGKGCQVTAEVTRINRRDLSAEILDDLSRDGPVPSEIFLVVGANGKKFTPKNSTVPHGPETDASISGRVPPPNVVPQQKQAAVGVVSRDSATPTSHEQRREKLVGQTMDFVVVPSRSNQREVSGQVFSALNLLPLDLDYIDSLYHPVFLIPLEDPNAMARAGMVFRATIDKYYDRTHARNGAEDFLRLTNVQELDPSDVASKLMKKARELKDRGVARANNQIALVLAP